MPPDAPALSLRNLTKHYGSQPALLDFSLEITPGEVVAILGPSGSGKSTLLWIIAGLLAAEGGSVAWQGVDLAGLPPERRNFGLMFQDYALFPHLNVFENIAFGLRRQHQAQAQIDRRVTEMLDLVGLPGFARRDVLSLSGGEQQRVALARALAPQPRLLLLDEPLGALDRGLRERLALDLRGILRDLHQTALYVTHDQEEAFLLADRVALLQAGRLARLGTPQEVYRQPGSVFAARFLGLDNIFPAQLVAGDSGWLARTALGEWRLPPQPGLTPGAAQVLLRPDEIETGEGGPVVLAGVLLSSLFRGDAWQVEVAVSGQRLRINLPARSELPQPGAALLLSFDPARAVQVMAEAQV